MNEQQQNSEHYPEVYFEHVLIELSKNRKDPCEIIRELIANSYDANASQIDIYPLLQYEGFIFFDNGQGISETEKINGITPYKAFFSIGKSTKVFGGSIGYKCQGSKLCFASKKFTLITRCQGEACWRSVSIDNPRDNLRTFNLTSRQEDEKPWDTLTHLFSKPDVHTQAILQKLDRHFFEADFTQGTLIIVQGIEIEDFSYYYGTDGHNHENIGSEWQNKLAEYELSYLRNYIRFNTKQGDVKILRAKETGFSASQENNFKTFLGYNETCRLSLWTKGTLKEIKPGYPYLAEPEKQDLPSIKTPSRVSRLSDGNFYYRAARSFKLNGYTYCIILAVDGNRRTLEKYQELNRQGQKGARSGIRLTDQRGVFICSQGIKICPYNELFERNGLREYEVLATSKGQSHYVLMIDGNFELVTDRNALSESALKVLKNSAFIKQLEEFLEEHSRNTVFGELINRLNGEKEEIYRDSYVLQLDSVKHKVQYRTRFKVKGIQQLTDLWLLAPNEGEENWVGGLYILFSHLVPNDSPYAKFWLRPRTFSGGAGLDSIAVALTENSLAANVHKGLEYKYNFSHKEEFNHLLTVTDHIVSWDIINSPQNQEQVQDAYNYYGYTHNAKELQEIGGYKIINIQSRAGDQHQGEIIVISLKKLLEKTFEIQWENPPPQLEKTPTKKRQTKKRR